MPRIKYHLVVAQGYPAVDAAASLDKKVNNLMEAGWEPSLGTCLVLDGDIYTAYQTMLWCPSHQDLKVTAGGHQERDPVTPIIGETMCFERDTPKWKEAWAALEEKTGDISTWMYMSSKVTADGRSWEHSFKHIETRQYYKVLTTRAHFE